MTGSRRLLVLALALGALLRVSNALQVRNGPLPYFHTWTESDMNFYDRWARDVATTDVLTSARMRPYHTGHAAAGPEASWDLWLGQRTFYQDPLYAYAVAAVYAAGGTRSTVFVLQALLGLGCVVLLHAIARRAFDPGVAGVTALIAALYGPLAFYELFLLKPVLITATGLLAVLALLRALETPAAPARWGLAGIACGLSVLAQSSALLFVVPAGAACAWILARRRQAWRAPLLVLAAGLAAALAPVVARNLAVGAPPFVLSATGAWTFLNHNADDYVPEGGDTVTRHAGEILGRTEGRTLPTVLATIRTHASFAGWLRLLARKAAVFWHWYEIPNNTNYYVYERLAPRLDSGRVAFGFVAPLALLGLLGAVRGPGERVVLVLHVVAGIATLVLFYSISRLRLPTAVALVPFAASGLVTLLRQCRARRFRTAALQAALVGAAATVVLRPLPARIPLIRVADYGVPNDITFERARALAGAGDAAGALSLLEAELRLEPDDLAAADPRLGEARLGLTSAGAAGSFARLHGAAALCAKALDRPDLAGAHRRRAEVLASIEAQFKRASR